MTHPHALVGSAVQDASIHDHLCLFYESQEEQFRSIVPFFAAGLAKGERCLYIADELDADQVLRYLRAGGIAVDRALQDGSLVLASKHESYLRKGHFDPDEMLAFLKEFIEATKAEGFSGLRTTAEMTWVLGGVPGGERLMEYEARINDFFQNQDIVAICQYNRRRFAPHLIKDVILTHPYLICEGRVCQNSYYVPTEEFLDPERESKEVDRILFNILQHQEERELLAQQSAAKDEFIGFVSHELKSPVSTIYGFAALLARRGSDLSQEVKEEAFDKIQQESQRVAKLVDDLLVLARLEGDELQLSPVSLQECVANSLEEFQQLQPGRTLVSNAGSNAAPVLGHQAYIERTLANLLSNADKFSPLGEPIEVRLTAAGSRASVSVLDHGNGIDPGELDRIFQPFYRGRNNGAQPGSGIGLTVVRRLIEAQGGRVWAEIREDGTAFTFDLPGITDFFGAQRKPRGVQN